MFSVTRLSILAAVLLAALLAFIYVNHLRDTVSSQAVTIERLENEKKGLEEAVRAIETVNKHRSETVKNLEEIKRDIQNEAEAPLPSPLASALMGLREQQLRASRAGQPASLPAKPDSPR